MNIAEDRLQELEALGREAEPFKAELKELCDAYRLVNEEGSETKKDNIKWQMTSDGRRTATTTGNKVMLCRYCTDIFPECPAIDVVFGDGEGSDNICSCASYRYSPVPRW